VDHGGRKPKYVTSRMYLLVNALLQTSFRWKTLKKIKGEHNKLH